MVDGYQEKVLFNKGTMTGILIPGKFVSRNRIVTVNLEVLIFL
jgi:hypothetical protein